jgi:hypothetical protein
LRPLLSRGAVPWTNATQTRTVSPGAQ